jgi:uncharacterized protein (DUF927 family)
LDDDDEVLENKNSCTMAGGEPTYLVMRGGNPGIIGTDSDYRDITKYFVKDIKRALIEEPREFIAHKTGWKRDNTIFVAGSIAYENDRETPVKLTNSDLSKALIK